MFSFIASAWYQTKVIKLLKSNLGVDVVADAPVHSNENFVFVRVCKAGYKASIPETLTAAIYATVCQNLGRMPQKDAEIIPTVEAATFETTKAAFGGQP